MPIYKMKGSKDGKQKYRVRINYIDNEGKSRQIDRVAYGSAEAKELERQLLYDIKHPSTTVRMTFQKLFEIYKKSVENEIRESTLQKTEKTILNHVIPYLGNVSLSKLTVPVLQNWKLKIDQKSLSIKTKKNIYSCFNAVLNWGVKLEYLPQNSLKKIGNFKSSGEIKKEMDYYTANEYQKYSAEALRMAQDDNSNRMYDYYVFFSIAFYTGLRKGEIHALKWSDINGKYLTVSRSINQKLKGEDRETQPKNKSSCRTLQIPEPLISILDQHKKRHQQLQGFHEDFRICGGTNPLRDTSIENMNKKIAKAAGIKKIRIHDFRHSHASLLANNGINIQEIARRLGHSNVEITWNTYSHLYPKEEERAISILNKIQ